MITTQVQLATLVKFCVSSPQLGCELLNCETESNLWKTLHSIIQGKIDARTHKLQLIETAIINADKMGSKEDIRTLEKWGATIHSEIGFLNELRQNLPRPIAPKVESVPNLSDLLRKYR